MSEQAVTSFKFIFPDWKILQGLFILKKKLIQGNFSIVSLFYFTLHFFCNIINYSCSFFYSLNSLNSYLKRYLSINHVNLSYFFNSFSLNLSSSLVSSIFTRKITNYYSSDIFCKNSKVMSICSVKVNNNLYF